MLKRLQNMKLKKKLNFGYTVVICLMVVSGIISIIALGILFGEINNYISNIERADSAVKICRINVNVAARNVREMVLNDDKDSYEKYRTRVNETNDEVKKELEIMEGTGAVDDELCQTYKSELTDWMVIAEEIMDSIEAGEDDIATKRILEECAPALNSVINTAKQIDELTDKESKQAITTSYISAIIGIAAIITSIVTAVILSKRIGKQIIQSITAPLYEIEAVAGELAAGNLHSNLDYRSDDEIGNLAHSLRKSIHTLGAYVDDIGRAMNEFSNGNFDVQPEVEWKGDFIQILDSFMSFEKSMANTVRSIQNVANQVTYGAEQIASSSIELAEGASDQAAITDQLSSTVEDVSVRVAQNANDAKNISERVGKVSEAITDGNKKMHEMVAAMQEINQSSTEISKIIATINDIASQTNLLALNASIEAARAGEAGKGFAVVADQVSVLAAQSAEAAKESTSLIETSVRAVEKGMVIADETAQQLEGVATTSKEVTTKVNSIAIVLDSQANAISKINDDVEHINDVVQTNSATSEECAAASQEMSSQAETLRNEISRFKVGDFEESN